MSRAGPYGRCLDCNRTVTTPDYHDLGPEGVVCAGCYAFGVGINSRKPSIQERRIRAKRRRTWAWGILAVTACLGMLTMPWWLPHLLGAAT